MSVQVIDRMLERLWQAFTNTGEDSGEPPYFLAGHSIPCSVRSQACDAIEQAEGKLAAA
jgi:hypothetical protein